MPVIRISEETMTRLKKWAKPLEDTAESAFVKVLDAAERNPVPPDKPVTNRPSPRRTGQDKLSQEAFRRPLLESLYEMGGTAHVEALRPILEKRLAARLRPNDFAPLATGQPRWWSTTCWERTRLKEEGYLRGDSKRGVWALSEKGASYVAESLAAAPEHFIDHLLAIPNVGTDADFSRSRSGPRRLDM